MKRDTAQHRSSTRRLVLFAAIALGLFVACGGKDVPGSKALATVNGREVTAAEFDAYMKIKHVPPGDKTRREQALRDYLEREALAEVIQKEGVLDAAEVKAEVREFEKQLLLSRYFDKLLEDKVSDAALRNYYSQNAERYEEKKVRVAHLLFRVHPNMSEAERKAKLTAAQEAHAKLRTGASFAELAEAVSDDKLSARKGGEIGWLTADNLDPRFAQKIFSLQKDELSEPFETSFGYHVAKVLEGPQAVKKPFEAVQGDIRYQLRAEARKAEMQRLEAKMKVQRKDAAAKTDKAGEPEGKQARAGEQTASNRK